jgi:phosphoserine phosphatase
MLLNSWQLDVTISAVLFDCDGTLSAIEGIDELAKNNNATDIVQRLTQDAMGKSGMNINLYQQRLDLIKPTHDQVLQLGEEYIAHQVPDVLSVVQMLQGLNKSIYIISAGLFPAVSALGTFLNVPIENIYAVHIQFDSDGNYSHFDDASPLVNRNGKRVIVEKIKKKHEETAYIGDGLNDLEVKDFVTRFIGYGGIFYRNNIEKACQYYLKSASMTALLPFILTQQEVEGLTEKEKKLYMKGLGAINDSQR